MRIAQAGSVWGRLGWFAATIAAAAVLAFPLGWAFSGHAGLLCVLAAASVCCATGMAALLVQEVWRDPQLVLLQVAAGFLLRAGGPLGLALVVHLRGGPLSAAGFVFYLLAFYMLALTAGTALGVSPARPPSAKG